jgi:hypothetical protein
MPTVQPQAPQTALPMPYEQRQPVAPQTTQEPSPPVQTAEPAPKPQRTGHNIGEYRQMLARAREAGDTEAVAYFQSQIDRGLKKQAAKAKGLSGRDHGALTDVLGGMEGNIADAALQGLTFGFSDELAGIGGGLASEAMNQLGYEGEGFSKGYNEIRDWVEDRAIDYSNRNPVKGTIGEIGGGLVFPLGAIRSGLGTGFKMATGSGALYGAGKSRTDQGDSLSDQMSDVATDTLTGGAFGAGGYGALRALGGLFRAVTSRVNPAARDSSGRSTTMTKRWKPDRKTPAIPEKPRV